MHLPAALKVGPERQLDTRLGRGPAVAAEADHAQPFLYDIRLLHNVKIPLPCCMNRLETLRDVTRMPLTPPYKHAPDQ